MKKIIACVLSLILLCGCVSAFAESAAKETITMLGAFSITYDKLPESYTMEVLNNTEMKYSAVLSSSEAAKPTYILAITFNDALEGVNTLADATAADIEMVKRDKFYSLVEQDDGDILIEDANTGLGTPLLVGKATDGSFAAIYTIYRSHEIEVIIYHESDAAVTDEEINTMITFLTDVDFTPLEKGAALPAYVYPFGDDPVGAAVVDYMLNNNFGCLPEEGGVLIPTPVILKTETNADETETTVYGNFWLFAYKLDGKILKVTSCGECPGVMKLEKKEDAWTVASAEFAGDGEKYAEDIARFANGDKELEALYLQSTGASEDSILPQYQRAAVVAYVNANQLDVEAYQDNGADPVSVTD